MWNLHGQLKWSLRILAKKVLVCETLKYEDIGNKNYSLWNTKKMNNKEFVVRQKQVLVDNRYSGS